MSASTMMGMKPLFDKIRATNQQEQVTGNRTLGNDIDTSNFEGFYNAAYNNRNEDKRMALDEQKFAETVSQNKDLQKNALNEFAFKQDQAKKSEKYQALGLGVAALKEGASFISNYKASQDQADMMKLITQKYGDTHVENTSGTDPEKVFGTSVDDSSWLSGIFSGIQSYFFPSGGK